MIPWTRLGALPIFQQPHSTYTLFYTPGCLAKMATSAAEGFAAELLSCRPIQPAAKHLLERAVLAQQRYNVIQTEPFTPVCLTLYLNNECNLRCQYCFSEPDPHPSVRLSIDAVKTAAEQVAANCQAQNRPFVAVFHGGGEPTLDQDYADSLLNVIEQTAAAYHVDLFRYIATNGVMPAAKAAWIARRFDQIGISCDGPAAIQSIQRPTRGGENTTASVERTAQIVRDAGKRLLVRATITPESTSYQTEIADYLCTVIQPHEIHVEPIYRLGRARTIETQLDAELFVTEFLRGQAVAKHYGIEWSASGSRVRDIHGPYCQVFRHVLHLVPGDAVSACFIVVSDQDDHLLIGSNGLMDEDRVQTLRQNLSPMFAQCEGCFNRYHCVRACPEICGLDDLDPAGTFRCLVQQMLTDAYLQDLAHSIEDNSVFITMNP